MKYKVGDRVRVMTVEEAINSGMRLYKSDVDALNVFGGGEYEIQQVGVLHSIHEIIYTYIFRKEVDEIHRRVSASIDERFLSPVISTDKFLMDEIDINAYNRFMFGENNGTQ